MAYKLRTSNKSFDQLVERHSGDVKSVLVGNGFNLRSKLLKKRFDWHAIGSKSKLSPSFAKEILKSHEFQYERALEKISVSLATMRLSEEPMKKKAITNLEQAEGQLKEDFFRAVIKSHPPKRRFCSQQSYFEVPLYSQEFL